LSSQKTTLYEISQIQTQCFCCDFWINLLQVAIGNVAPLLHYREGLLLPFVQALLWSNLLCQDVILRLLSYCTENFSFPVCRQVQGIADIREECDSRRFEHCPGFWLHTGFELLTEAA